MLYNLANIKFIYNACIAKTVSVRLSLCFMWDIDRHSQFVGYELSLLGDDLTSDINQLVSGANFPI